MHLYSETGYDSALKSKIYDYSTKQEIMSNKGFIWEMNKSELEIDN